MKGLPWFTPILGAEAGAVIGYGYAITQPWLAVTGPLWVELLFIATCCVVGAALGYAITPEEVSHDGSRIHNHCAPPH